MFAGATAALADGPPSGAAARVVSATPSLLARV